MSIYPHYCEAASSLIRGNGAVAYKIRANFNPYIMSSKANAMAANAANKQTVEEFYALIDRLSLGNIQERNMSFKKFKSSLNGVLKRLNGYRTGEAKASVEEKAETTELLLALAQAGHSRVKNNN